MNIIQVITNARERAKIQASRARQAVANTVRSLPLGDIVTSALSRVGITKERVTRVLGKPCGCKERSEMLNQLSLAAARVIEGKQESSKHLEEVFVGIERKGNQTPCKEN